MNRPLIAGSLVLAASFAAFGLWRFQSTDDELSAAQRRLDDLATDFEKERTRAESLQARVREAQKEIRTLAEEVRSRQDCRVPNQGYRSPHLTLVPNHGPVGTRVALVGDCFLSKRWDSGYGLFLIRQFVEPRECELIAGGDHELKIEKTGRARGFFIVPATGSCFQHDYGRGVTPGVYQLGVGCHACTGRATFRVTAS